MGSCNVTVRVALEKYLADIYSGMQAIYLKNLHFGDHS
jgi:hypothetical protein